MGNIRELNEYVDLETGEKKTYRRGQNFLKMNRNVMMALLDVIGGGKAKVVLFLIKNLHLSNNIVLKTQQEIAKGSNVSLKTVSTVLKELEERKLIKKKAGSLMVSPDLFYRGDEGKKQMMIKAFNNFKGL